ncbi:MAG: ABC transporter substrate-binding protein [Gammaproteobacteria bacterium]|nr:ABC transporter substrate-binding protein [Gammaproteobacteria bacterium]
MKMATRIGVALLSGLFWLSPPAMAQGAQEPFEIFAVLWRGETKVEDGFRDYLNRRGISYNLTVRNLDLDRDKAPAVVEEIKRVRPDLVYTWGTATTSSIIGKLETDTPGAHVRDVPGVFVMVSYPLQSGIVATLENPGRAATGVSFLPSVSAQLKTIETYGKFKNIAVIYEPNASNSRVNVEELQRDIREFDMNLIELPVPLLENGRPDPAQIPVLIQSAKDKGADLLYMGPDSFLVSHANAYTSEAIAAGLPTFASSQDPLKNSRAMFGLVTDYYTLGKLAALQAERILVERQHPQDLPVAQLARYKLWINIDVVREVGIYPPMKMISIADFKTSPGS